METNEGVSNLGLPDDGHWPDKILSKATKMENKTCVVLSSSSFFFFIFFQCIIPHLLSKKGSIHVQFACH